MSQRNLRRKVYALLLAARQSLMPRRKLSITRLDGLFSALPSDFRLVVADVGSIGGLHKRWKALQPWLFTLNFDPLDTRNAAAQERYFPFLLAASDGMATLKVTRRSSMSSTHTPRKEYYAPFWKKPGDIEIVEMIETATTSLDSIVEEEGVWPDALKIDVQGGEANVLDGAVETLKRSVILAEIECSFAERYVGQETFDQILRRMRAQGFALLDIRRLKRYRFRNSNNVQDPSLGRGMRAGQLAFCDAIFIREPTEIFRIAESEEDGTIGLKAMVLALTYGKADLAAAIFDRCRGKLPTETEDAFGRFFRGLANDGALRHQLHLDFDSWSQRV